MSLDPIGMQFLKEHLRRLRINLKNGKSSHFLLFVLLAVIAGDFVLISLFSSVPMAQADPGYYLAAREVTLSKAGDTTTSSVLSPIKGAAIRFSFKKPRLGNIAVYASFSSDTAAGSKPKTGIWDIELYDVQRHTTVADSHDVERYLSGIFDQGMIGVCDVFSGLKQDVTYEIRLRHATNAGTLRTKTVNMVMIPLFSDNTISLNYAKNVRTKSVKTRSTSYVDTNLIGHISLELGITGAYIMITAAINSESRGVGGGRTGTWKIQAGQGGSYRDYGTPVQRYLSGAHDIGSVVLHALAGPFDASDGDVGFKLQHKTNRGEIVTFNGTLIAIALSDYDGRTRTQYDYLWGQDSSNGNITTDSSSLTAAYEAKTGDRVHVSPELKSQARVFVGANFTNNTPVPATVTYDIAKGGASQVQAVTRVMGSDDMGAGSLFGISDVLRAGTHDLDLRHSTSSMLNTSGANLVYVILGYDRAPE